MTISREQSAPLVVVVGATGIQGGSVIQALSESDKPYRIRGFTRDVSKQAAQDLSKKGVEMVAVNLVVQNRDAVFKAFEGATVAFVRMTLFDAPQNVKLILEFFGMFRSLRTSGSTCKSTRQVSSEATYSAPLLTICSIPFVGGNGRQDAGGRSQSRPSQASHLVWP